MRAYIAAVLQTTFSCFFTLSFFLLLPVMITGQTIFSWEGIDASVLNVETDYDNNRLVIGYAYPPHDLDPGPGFLELDTNGEDTYYLASYTRSGEINFVIPFYNPEVGSANAIFDLTVDGLNNIYVVGTFKGSLDLDPSGEEFWVSADDIDAESSFLASYDQRGNFRYGVRLPEFHFSRYGDYWGDDNQVVAADEAGNVFVMVDAGEREVLDIDPGPEELRATVPVVAAYDLEGALRYAIPVPGAFAETVIDVSSEGILAIAGNLYSDFDFDPGPGSVILDRRPTNGYFLATYQLDGSLRAARDIRGTLMITLFLEWDQQQRIYLGGNILDDTDFAPNSPGGFATDSDGDDSMGDLFFARYTRDAIFESVTVIRDSLGQQSEEFPAAFKTTPAGDLYIVVSMDEGYVDLQPGPGSQWVGPGDDPTIPREVFIAGFDPDSQPIYYQRLNFQEYEFFPVVMEKHCPNLVIAEKADSGDFPDWTTDVGGDSISFVVPEWTPFVMTLPVASSATDTPADCDAVVATTEISSVHTIQIYPNPASTSIQVEFQDYWGDAQLELYDGLGRLQKSYRYHSTDGTLSLPVDGLSAQLYWLRITGLDGSPMGVLPVLVQR